MNQQNKKSVKRKLDASLVTRLIFTCFFMLSIFTSIAQDSIRISGKFLNNTQYAKVVVNKFNVGSNSIAAVPIDKTSGEFTVNLSKAQLEPGVYRLQYSQTRNEFVDVILNGQESEIDFTVDAVLDDKHPEFSSSKENQLWYNYQKKAKNQLLKIAALQQVLTSYPDTFDNVYKKNQIFYKEAKEKYLKSQAAFITQHPETWACKMVANQPQFFPNPENHWRLQLYNQWQYFWEGVDTQNPQLINTPLYTNHILNYLQYYMSPEMQFSEEEVTEGFIKSTDTIMSKFGGNPQTQEFAYKYLSLGFNEIKQKEVLQYLEETYTAVAEQCMGEDEKDALDQRLKAYEALKMGNKAPDITFTPYTYFPKGVTASSLAELKSDKYLIVFAAGWCPHCTKAIPKVAAKYPELKAQGIEVILVSLDETAQDFAKFAAPLPFISTTDLQKWDGKAVQDYQVYATPSYFMLDKDLKITGKYSSFEAVLK